MSKMPAMRAEFSKKIASTASGRMTRARGKIYSRRKYQSQAVQNTSIRPTPSRPEQISLTCTETCGVINVKVAGSTMSEEVNGLARRLTRRNVKAAAGPQSDWLALNANIAPAAGIKEKNGSVAVSRTALSHALRGASAAKSASAAAKPEACHASANSQNGAAARYNIVESSAKGTNSKTWA